MRSFARRDRFSSRESPGGPGARTAASSYPASTSRSSRWTGSSSRCDSSVMAVGLVALVVLLFLVVLFLISAIKVAREYERGIVFRLGRLFPEPKGPGLFLLTPVVDRMSKVHSGAVTLNSPRED